jgi:hypothetical protein
MVRKWRPWLVLVTLSLAWKVIVLGIGGVVPALFMDDGIATLPPDLQPYGMRARQIARSLWNRPIERLGIRHIRLVSAERRPTSADAAQCGGLVAHVRAYTYFAIPYSDVRTVCDSGIVQYRGFSRLR